MQDIGSLHCLNDGRDFPVCKDDFSIGSDTACDLRLRRKDNPSTYCIIKTDVNTVSIYSSNPNDPVFLNEEPIQGGKELHDGDKIRLKDTTFQWKCNTYRRIFCRSLPAPTNVVAVPPTRFSDPIIVDDDLSVQEEVQSITSHRSDQATVEDEKHENAKNINVSKTSQLVKTPTKKFINEVVSGRKSMLSPFTVSNTFVNEPRKEADILCNEKKNDHDVSVETFDKDTSLNQSPSSQPFHSTPKTSANCVETNQSPLSSSIDLNFEISSDNISSKFNANTTEKDEKSKNEDVKTIDNLRRKSSILKKTINESNECSNSNLQVTSTKLEKRKRNSKKISNTPIKRPSDVNESRRNTRGRTSLLRKTFEERSCDGESSIKDKSLTTPEKTSDTKSVVFNTESVDETESKYIELSKSELLSVSDENQCESSFIDKYKICNVVKSSSPTVAKCSRNLSYISPPENNRSQDYMDSMVSTPKKSPNTKSLNESYDVSLSSLSASKMESLLNESSPLSLTRKRRSTGFVPFVGTPSNVYRMTRKMSTPFNNTRSSRISDFDTVERPRGRKRSVERRSTPFKITRKSSVRDSVSKHTPIKESISFEEMEAEEPINDSKFKFVTVRRRHRYNESSFATENKILEESDQSGTETEDESLDSSNDTSTAVTMNASSYCEGLNDLTTDKSRVHKANKSELKSILTPLPKSSSAREKSAKKVTFVLPSSPECSKNDSECDIEPSFAMINSHRSYAEEEYESDKMQSDISYGSVSVNESNTEASAGVSSSCLLRTSEADLSGVEQIESEQSAYEKSNQVESDLKLEAEYSQVIPEISETSNTSSSVIPEHRISSQNETCSDLVSEKKENSTNEVARSSLIHLEQETGTCSVATASVKKEIDRITRSTNKTTRIPGVKSWQKVKSSTPYGAKKSKRNLSFSSIPAKKSSIGTRSSGQSAEVCESLNLNESEISIESTPGQEAFENVSVQVLNEMKSEVLPNDESNQLTVSEESETENIQETIEQMVIENVPESVENVEKTDCDGTVRERTEIIDQIEATKEKLDSVEKNLSEFYKDVMDELKNKFNEIESKDKVNHSISDSRSLTEIPKIVITESTPMKEKPSEVHLESQDCAFETCSSDDDKFITSEFEEESLGSPNGSVFSDNERCESPVFNIIRRSPRKRVSLHEISPTKRQDSLESSQCSKQSESDMETEFVSLDTKADDYSKNDINCEGMKQSRDTGTESIVDIESNVIPDGIVSELESTAHSQDLDIKIDVSSDLMRELDDELETENESSATKVTKTCNLFDAVSQYLNDEGSLKERDMATPPVSKPFVFATPENKNADLSNVSSMRRCSRSRRIHRISLLNTSTPCTHPSEKFDCSASLNSTLAEDSQKDDLAESESSQSAKQRDAETLPGEGINDVSAPMSENMENETIDCPTYEAVGAEAIQDDLESMVPVDDLVQSDVEMYSSVETESSNQEHILSEFSNQKQILNNSEKKKSTDVSNREQSGSESSNEQILADSPNQEQTLSGSPNREDILTKSPNQKQTPSGSPNCERILIKSSSQEETPLESLNQEQILTESSSQEQTSSECSNREQILTESSSQEQTPSGSPNREDILIKSSSQEQTPSGSPNRKQIPVEFPNQEQIKTESANGEEILVNAKPSTVQFRISIPKTSTHESIQSLSICLPRSSPSAIRKSTRLRKAPRDRSLDVERKKPKRGRPLWYEKHFRCHLCSKIAPICKRIRKNTIDAAADKKIDGQDDKENLCSLINEKSRPKRIKVTENIPAPAPAIEVKRKTRKLKNLSNIASDESLEQTNQRSTRASKKNQIDQKTITIVENQSEQRCSVIVPMLDPEIIRSPVKVDESGNITVVEPTKKRTRARKSDIPATKPAARKLKKAVTFNMKPCPEKKSRTRRPVDTEASEKKTIRTRGAALRESVAPQVSQVIEPVKRRAKRVQNVDPVDVPVEPKRTRVKVKPIEVSEVDRPKRAMKIEVQKIEPTKKPVKGRRPSIELVNVEVSAKSADVAPKIVRNTRATVKKIENAESMIKKPSTRKRIAENNLVEFSNDEVKSTSGNIKRTRTRKNDASEVQQATETVKNTRSRNKNIKADQLSTNSNSLQSDGPSSSKMASSIETKSATKRSIVAKNKQATVTKKGRVSLTLKTTGRTRSSKMLAAVVSPKNTSTKKVQTSRVTRQKAK